MHREHYWVGFNLVKGIGPSRLRALWVYFDHDMEAAWNAAPQELLSAGLGDQALNTFLKFRKEPNLDPIFDKIQRAHAHVCTLDDDEYPTLLRELPDGPPLLYIRGRIFPEDDLALAMVGTRKATTYGLEIARRIATAMAHAGVTVVSGLARGLDTVSHEAALAAGGRTIAVMGNGIDQLYPSENRALATKIIDEGLGAIVTEYPPGTPPLAENFPARNRIISGLSLGVLIVEAPKSSGALLTAQSALDQGREVFAIPGNITSPNSEGTNSLIQDGAKLVMRPEDILEELNVSRYTLQTKQAVKSIVPDSPEEVRLLEIIALEPVHLDDISIQSGLPIHQVASMMTVMELKGLVQAVGAMMFQMSPNVDLDSFNDSLGAE
ncbi:MAG: DNA-protecting protein DprA [Chloroflexi bacterium]|nr:DNA-protecting protein DprA [Chloroflexota bacterium]